MSQRIELRALVARDGRLLLTRAPGSEWALPGGAFTEEADDVDAAMDTLLREIGVISPDIREDFLETSYLGGDPIPVVLNLYAPITWAGEPAAPPGHEHGWFDLEELDLIEMDDAQREAVMRIFGLSGSDEDGPPTGPVDVIDFTAAVASLMDERAGATANQPPPEEPAAEEPTAPPDRRRAGLDVLGTLSGTGDGAAAAEGLRGRVPELADDIIDFALGDVWSRPALDRKTRSLQVVAMLAAMGGRGGPLRSHVNGALNHGASPEQVIETLRMVAVYAGFPAALEAWAVMEEVFAARGIERGGGGGE